MWQNSHLPISSLPGFTAFLSLWSVPWQASQVVPGGSNMSSALLLVFALAWHVAHVAPTSFTCFLWLTRSVIFCGGKMTELGPVSGSVEPGGSHWPGTGLSP